MDFTGRIRIDGAYTGDEHHGSRELLDILTQSYWHKAEAGELRAAAIRVDVRVVPPGKSDKVDAISAGLEHPSSDAVSLFLPHQKGWFGPL